MTGRDTLGCDSMAVFHFFTCVVVSIGFITNCKTVYLNFVHLSICISYVIHTHTWTHNEKDQKQQSENAEGLLENTILTTSLDTFRKKGLEEVEKSPGK